jgi:hypothetical protein
MLFEARARLKEFPGGWKLSQAMTRIEMQDELAKTSLHFDKALLAGLAVGLIFFFVSRGIPWFSSEIPDAAMGRPLYSGMPDQTAFIKTVGVHFLLALGYGIVTAGVIYRLGPWAAVWTGAAVGLGLWALNFLLFRFAFGYPAVNEVPIAVTHIIVGMTLAGAYKALAVPQTSGPPART